MSKLDEKLPSYAHLMFIRQSCIWPILCLLMAILAKLLDMDFKFVLPSIYIKVNVNAGQKKLKSISNNLAKIAINWHKIGQMPLWRMNIKWA